MSLLILTSQTGTPASPDTGKVELFANNSDKLSSINHAGTVTTFIDGTSAALITNKSLDTTNKIVDSSDNTKVLQPSLSGMAAAAILTLASAQQSSQTLTLPAIREAETLAVQPQVVTTLSTPLNPTGTSNTSGLMMGLAQLITPQVTGRVLVTICGSIANNTNADGAAVEIRMGTGSAPANAGALTGTIYGSQATFTNMPTANAKWGFSLTALVTGLTVGTQYWIDVDLKAITGGTATISSVTVSANEL
jgi:hypothetical protein